MSEPTLEGYTAEQNKVWGKYVAKERIYIGGALAFNPGDPVPSSHVDRDNAPVAKSQVVGANTKAAAAATQEG